MGPVRQNPIQRTVRTAHLSLLMTVHNCSTQYSTFKFLDFRKLSRWVAALNVGRNQPKTFSSLAISTVLDREHVRERVVISSHCCRRYLLRESNDFLSPHWHTHTHTHTHTYTSASIKQLTSEERPYIFMAANLTRLLSSRLAQRPPPEEHQRLGPRLNLQNSLTRLTSPSPKFNRESKSPKFWGIFYPSHQCIAVISNCSNLSEL